MSGASSESGPSVSAVVINFNGDERTIRCLNALAGQTRAPDRVVVVDNGSSDGSPERIRDLFPDIEVIELGENRGLPAARNEGLSAVHSDLVLLIDNDIYLEPDCLRRLIQAQIETTATVVCPRIRLIPQRDVVQAEGAAAHFIGTMALLNGYRPIGDAPAERSPVPGCIGACYLLERGRVLEDGGFDEDYFFYFEDLEFMLRLAARGHDFVCERGALVYHDRGQGTPGLSFRSSGEYPRRRAYLSMRNRWLTMFIHYRTRTLILLSPALVLYELAVVVWALTHGWTGEWVRSWVWHMRRARSTTVRRRAERRRRVRPDRELLVGGTLPQAPGLAQGWLPRAAISVLSHVLNAYWRAVRPLVA